jgi:hypothetical protein
MRHHSLNRYLLWGSIISISAQPSKSLCNTQVLVLMIELTHRGAPTEVLSLSASCHHLRHSRILIALSVSSRNTNISATPPTTQSIYLHAIFSPLIVSQSPLKHQNLLLIYFSGATNKVAREIFFKKSSPCAPFCARTGSFRPIFHTADYVT